jgi:hypothetical protein
MPGITGRSRAREDLLDELLLQNQRAAEQVVILPEPLVKPGEQSLNLADQEGQALPL